MPRDELLDVYYDLYDILQSIETIADALRELQNVRKPKSKIIEHLEALRLYHFEKELNALYEDMPLGDLKAFKIKQLSYGHQTTIEDFL